MAHDHEMFVSIVLYSARGCKLKLVVACSIVLETQKTLKSLSKIYYETEMTPFHYYTIKCNNGTLPFLTGEHRRLVYTEYTYIC